MHVGPSPRRRPVARLYQGRIPAHHLLIVPARPPLIGIVTHEVRSEPEPAWAPAPDRSARDRTPPRLSLRLSYTQAVQEAGGIAVVLPAHGYVDDVALLVDRLDGLLFAGGPDLDPVTYGRDPHPELGPEVDHLSDEYERALLDEATARDLPQLAICRGMQALNVSRGGTLHQHLPDRTELEHLQTLPPYEVAHPVSVLAGSPLHRITQRHELDVNTFHHQAVNVVGKGLVPCAHAPDGTIEALFDPDLRFCLGVQWHAELLTHRAEHAPLLRELVAASSPVAAPLRLVA